MDCFAMKHVPLYLNILLEIKSIKKPQMVKPWWLVKKLSANKSSYRLCKLPSEAFVGQGLLCALKQWFMCGCLPHLYTHTSVYPWLFLKCPHSMYQPEKPVEMSALIWIWFKKTIKENLAMWEDLIWPCAMCGGVINHIK